MKTLELDPSTTEGWAIDDAVEAEKARRLAEATALDTEIRGLVQRERLNRVDICDRLARMRRERLHEPLNYGSFTEYAVAVGAAGSHRAARQQADLAEQLEHLPELRRALESGRADWTKVREAAEVATPESDARWATQVVEGTYDEVRAKAQEIKGEKPTRRITFEVPLEVHARFRQFVDSTGERLGERVTYSEAFELMLETAARSEPPCPRGQEEDAKPPSDRVPPPSATLVGYICELCDETSVPGPDGGLVVLSPARAALLECDAVIQEADGTRTRKIPPRIRSLVYARDRGTCRFPGCGARGFLHEHHEGERGWRETGHDPDRVCLLCMGHHTQRHKGLLKIEPLGGGRFRFFGADGKERADAHVGNRDPPS